MHEGINFIFQAQNSSRKDHKCRICNSLKKGNLFVAQEMMFGFNTSFEYYECVECGCLQIVNIPQDISRYYPDHYYSFAAPVRSSLIRFLKRRWLDHALGQKTLLGILTTKLLGAPSYADWIKRTRVSKNAAILDVGCGQGHLLLNLQNAGFLNLTGVDPYIESDLIYGKGLRILKRELNQVEDQYDLIMLHHSLEHMPEQQEVMKEVWRLLKPDAIALVRIPLSGSYAWRNYGVNWVQLDAPRHFFLHTRKSFSLLAEQTGFRIVEIVYDSNEFQFWGSEQYKQGISLMNAKSYLKTSSALPKRQVLAFKAQAAKLNEKQDGDQACFFLRKS